MFVCRYRNWLLYFFFQIYSPSDGLVIDSDGLNTACPKYYKVEEEEENGLNSGVVEVSKTTVCPLTKKKKKKKLGI